MTINALPKLLPASLLLLTVVGTTPACTLSSPPQPETQSPTRAASAWETVGQLPTPLESHKMVPLDDFVYVIGGWNATKGIHEDVFFTQLTSEGRLENWQRTTVPLPLKLQHHEVVTHNSALYVLGGDNGFFPESSVSNRIFRAVPTPQGDITEWTDVGQLPAPVTIHATTLVDDQLYIVGGSPTFRPGDVPVTDQIFTARILPDGTFSQFESLTAFPTVIGWLTTTAIGQRIFAISGNTQFQPARLADTVWVADIGPDNQLSPFQPTSTLVPRRRHATVLIDRTLVVIAGGGARGVLASVEAATVDEQGQLSAWTSLPPLPQTLYAHAAFAQDGYVYVSGGFLRYGSTDTTRDIVRLRFPR